MKIIGGIEALPYSWPATVFLKREYKYYRSKNVLVENFSCAGTLIRRNVVLTAAHCMEDVFYDDNNDISAIYEPNEFHPTAESTYALYGGLFNLENIENISEIKYPIVKMTVLKAIRVTF